MSFTVPANLREVIAAESNAAPRIRSVIPVGARIDLFLAKLGKVSPSASKATSKLVQDEIAHLREAYKLPTVSSYLTDYRKAIARRLGPAHPAIPMFLSEPSARKVGARGYGLTSHEVKQLRDIGAARVVQIQSARRQITDPVGMIQKAIRALKSPKWNEVAAGLLLLTGRRQVEILKTAEFRRTKDKWHPLFRGQVKTREAEGTQTDWYSIPVLTPAPAVLKAVSALRLLIPLTTKSHVNPAKLTNEQVHSRLAAMVWTAARSIFGPDWAPKDLRAAHACMCYELFAHESMSQAAYYARILGHQRLVQRSGLANPERHTAAIADLKTAAYYLQFYIPRAVLRDFSLSRVARCQT